MVADTDKTGNQEDEYLSEVTSEEQIEGGEFSQFNDPLAGDVGMEDMVAAAPQKPSAMRKVGTAIVLVIVALIVSMYLSHKQKVKEEAESGSASLTKISTGAPSEKQTTAAEKSSTSADKSLDTKNANDQPKVADQNTATPPVANNASLAAAISKSVSAAAPAKTETKALTDSADKVSAVTESVPEATEKKAEISPALSTKPSETNKTVESTKSTESAAKPSEVAATIAKTSEAVTEKSKTPEAPAKVSEVVSASTSTDAPKIMGKVDDLSLQTQANQTKISDLSTRLDTVDKSLGDLNKTLESLEKKMNVPVAVSQPVVTKIAKEPVLIKAPVAEPEKIVANKKMKVAMRHGNHRSHGIKSQPPMRVQNQQALRWDDRSNVVVTYVLRAVIPGRAWIERPLGGVLTIMEGESVPGLGKVTRIDADNGEVTLDTGDVIKYGTDDH